MRSPRKSVPQAARRLAALLAAFAMLFSIAFGGTRYFFCAGMDRIHGEDACCAHFEPSTDDRLRAEREAEDRSMAISELEAPCCEARHHGVLPGAVAAVDGPPLESPWVAVLAAFAPQRVVSQLTAAAAYAAFDRIETGPPPDSAPATCALLSVFVL